MGRPVINNRLLMGFGYNDVSSTGTSFVYYGGRYEKSDGTSVSVVNGNVSIASGTNYVELNYSTGVITSNQVGFTSGRAKLWQVVSNGANITSYTDYRTPVIQPGISDPVTLTGQTLDVGITTYPTAVYFDTGTSSWKKTAANSSNVIALATASGTIQVGGKATGLSGLTPNSVYYMSDTVAGGLNTTNTAGTKLGVALNSTEFIINIRNSSYTVPLTSFWAFTTGVTESGGGSTLTGTALISNWTSQYARTNSFAVASGSKISATASTANDTLLGFLEENTTYTNYTSLEYLVEMGNGTLVTYTPSFVNFGSYSNGDIITLQMNAGGSVVLKKNHVLIHTFPNSPLGTNYKTVAAIYTAGTALSGLTQAGSNWTITGNIQTSNSDATLSRTGGVSNVFGTHYALGAAFATGVASFTIKWVSGSNDIVFGFQDADFAPGENVGYTTVTYPAQITAAGNVHILDPGFSGALTSVNGTTDTLTMEMSAGGIVTLKKNGVTTVHTFATTASGNYKPVVDMSYAGTTTVNDIVIT